MVIKDKFLFASFGDRGLGMIAQDPEQHPGSIIRIKTDGSLPPDNPKAKGKKELASRDLSNWVTQPSGNDYKPK